MLFLCQKFPGIILFCASGLFSLSIFGVYAQNQPDTSFQNRPDTARIDSLWYLKGDKDFNLIIAADSGEKTAVLYLLNQKANINKSTEEGNTPLMYASQNGNIEIVKILVLNGADINHRNIYGSTALIGAVQTGQDEVSDYLIQHGAALDSMDNDHVTALMHAAANGFNILTDMLLYYGANPLQKDSEGNDALMVATYNNQPEIASILHKYKANVNSIDIYWMTPLMVAAREGHTDLADSLLNWGANPNQMNLAGYTALALAVRYNHPDIVKLLVQKNSKLNQNIRSGIRPLDLARGNPSMDSLLRKNGAHRSPLPDYNELITGFDFSLNLNDYMNGLHFGLYDTKFHTILSLGFITRVAAKKLFVPINENLWFQYWERRFMIWAGFEKQFPLSSGHNGVKNGITAGFREGYTFGNYRGSSVSAAKDWLFCPAIGVYSSGRYLKASIGYEHVKYPCYQVSPHRICISVSIHFPYKRDLYNTKSLYWLHPNN